MFNARFFSTAISIKIALAFVFSLVAVQGATCPVAPPVPLRILYQRSDKIVQVRLESISDDKIIDDDVNYTIVSQRHVFSVLSTLKGKAETRIVLYENDYRRKLAVEPETQSDETAQSNEPPAEDAAAEAEEDEVRFKVGKQFLLFLRKDEERDGYSLTDFQTGAKQLSDADFRVYEKRIAEIGAILASPEKQVERTVDWLVRCAEDPATRWEGVYELNLSFEMLEYAAHVEAAEKADKAERAANGETEDKNEAEEAKSAEDEGLYGAGGNPKFAQMLTAQQKEKLTGILLESFEKTAAAKNQTANEDLSRGDTVLLELVGHWGDERLVTFLLTRLRNFAGADGEDASQFMRVLGRLLENEKLDSLTENYEEILYEKGDDEIAAATEESEENTEENESETGGAKEAEANKAQTPENEKQPKKTTYQQRRAQIISDFLAESEKLRTQPKEIAARNR